MTCIFIMFCHHKSLHLHVLYTPARSVLPPRAQSAILEIRRGLGQFGYLMRSYSGRSMTDDSFESSNFRSIVANLSLADLNTVLYRCRGEEESDGNGYGTYNIPGYGHMLYCGLRGKNRALDKECIYISKMAISSPNPMFDHLLESSHRDDSNKW